MNTLILTSSVFMALSAASGPSIDNRHEFRWDLPAKSTLTRAEVKQDLLRAMKDGTFYNGEGERQTAAASSQRSRAEVRAEALEARQPSPFIDFLGN